MLVLNGDVPNRFWTCKDVSYNHFKVFDCRTLVLVPKDKRSKLESNSKECIYLGYGNEEFVYKFWDHIEKNIIRSRYVFYLKSRILKMFRRELAMLVLKNIQSTWIQFLLYRITKEMK